MSGFLDYGSQGAPEHRVAERSDRVVSRAEVRQLLLHPDFRAACREAMVQTIADHRESPLLHRVFGDRGQFMMGLFALYLHNVPLDGEPDAGLTVGRFRALCARAGVASPGRATAMLNLMRFAGYLRRAPASSDRRRTLLEPTERLVAFRAQRWRHHFEAMSRIMPEGKTALRLWDQPWFRTAYLCESVHGRLSGFRFLDHAPELTHVLESLSGFMILLHVKLAADEARKPAAAPLTISELATRSRMSRAHVRNVLARARDEDLVERAAGQRGPIAALPKLHDAIHRFYASGFAFSGRCIRLAAGRLPPDVTRPPARPM